MMMIQICQLMAFMLLVSLNTSVGFDLSSILRTKNASAADDATVDAPIVPEAVAANNLVEETDTGE